MTAKRQRLDLLLLEKGLVETRAKAQALILAGQIKVDGAVVTKVGTLVHPDKTIDLVSGPRYVSRGGDKLEGALSDFKLSPEGRVCLDVGASTGGFTDCLLQHGAVKIFAVDVGTAQLHSSLKTDPRIVSIERKHILELDPAVLNPPPSWVVVDVSFISLTKVLPRVAELTAKGTVVLALLKPQFEVGAKFLRKGVVKSGEVREQSLRNMVEFAGSNGFRVIATSPSRLLGPKGNQEYFLHLIKE